VAWKSKLQKTVMLSSTEDEYVGLSEVSGEILFIWDILKFIGIKIKLPIVMEMDNMGAIFLANNKSLGQCTKHVDMRYHFVCEYVEEGIIKIVYVCSEDNDADIMTQNRTGNIFLRHTLKFMDYSDVFAAKKWGGCQQVGILHRYFYVQNEC